MPKSFNNSSSRNFLISYMFPTNMWNVLGPFQPCFSMMRRNLLGVHHKCTINEWTLWRIATTSKVVTTSASYLHVITCLWINFTELLMELIVMFHPLLSWAFLRARRWIQAFCHFPKGDISWRLKVNTMLSRLLREAFDHTWLLSMSSSGIGSGIPYPKVNFVIK